MPAVGYLLWDDVKLVTVANNARMLCAAPQQSTYVVDFDDGAFGELITGRHPSKELVESDPRAGGVPPLIVDCKEETPP
jgi:hypothetical protein